ncbi:MAG: HK97 family phage prohead protease [Candidatus Aenigmatarchaeota archaeon]
MPEWVDRCVDKLMADPDFKPRKKDQTKRQAAWAVCTAQYKKKKEGFIMRNEKLNYDVGIRVQEAGISNNGDSITIQGIAINSTVTRNNIQYKAEELEKSAHTLIGKNIFMGHDTNPRESVGKVVWADYDSVDENVPFKAKIHNTSTYPDMVYRIKNKLIQNVSIGAQVEALTEEESAAGSDKPIRTAKGIEFLELSFVGIPGDRNATFTHAIAEKFKSNLKEENRGEKDMTDKEKETPKEDTEDKEEVEDTEDKEEVEDTEDKEEESLRKELESLKEEIKAMKEKEKNKVIKELCELDETLDEDELKTHTKEALQKMLELAKKVSGKGTPKTYSKESAEKEEKDYKIVVEGDGSIRGVPKDGRPTLY